MIKDEYWLNIHVGMELGKWFYEIICDVLQ